MNVNLHIERLVLDGLPITPSGGRMLQAALESELARLLAEHPGVKWRNDNLRQLSLAMSAPAQNVSPGKWGREAARTLHDGLTQTSAANSNLRRPPFSSTSANRK